MRGSNRIHNEVSPKRYTEVTRFPLRFSKNPMVTGEVSPIRWTFVQ